MSRLLPLWPLLAVTGCAAAPEARLTFDAGGVATVTVGDHVLLNELGVALVKPAWAGSLGDQRQPSHAARADLAGGTIVFNDDLAADGVASRLKLTVTPRPGGARLAYELTPAAETPVECVLLMGHFPTAGNAGAAHFIAAGEDQVDRGLFPKELDAEQYHQLGSRPATWVGLLPAAGPALRIGVEGLEVALQDDRKWNFPAFAFHGYCAQGASLKAGQPLTFAIDLSGAEAKDLEQAAVATERSSLATLTSAAPLGLGASSLDRASLPVGQTVELTATVNGTWDNPFDPDDVALDAVFSGPDGAAVTVPGFFDLPCQSALQAGREQVKPNGPAAWRVRFTPTQAGAWRVALTLRDRSGTVHGGEAAFKATAAPQDPGFVRTAAAAPGYFQFDSGANYFLVGENMGWASGRGTFDYADWLGGLGAAGGNWVRVWMSNWNCGPEWSGPSFGGLGKYNLAHAWKLDRILALARQNGVRVMVCLGTFGELTEGGYFNEGQWKSNPYNAANGGPCAKPADYFTNAAARKLYQRRLRYVVARWGADPYVFGWEFWNESNAPAAWVGEMAAWLKQHDPNHHLVSTTYGDDAVWKLKDVDFTMFHDYGDSGNKPDFTDGFRRQATDLRKYGKPFFAAECGIDWRTSDRKYDPDGKGQSLHDCLWGGVMCGMGGAPMLWYWDDYMHPKNVYHVLTPLTRFAAQVDWAHRPFAPLAGVTLRDASPRPETFEDLQLSTAGDWGRTGSGEFTVGQDGSVTGGPLAPTLGSPKRGGDGHELFSHLTFHLDQPTPGRFIAHVGTVSAAARLQLSLDGDLIVDQPLKTGKMGDGPWKTAVFRTEWQIWNCDYDQDYAIDVPAGKHEVTVANAEGDWVQVTRYRLTNYRSSRFPQAQALVLAAPGEMLLWLHDLKSNWRNVLEGRPPVPQTSLILNLPAAGAWQVSWWDTWKGTVLRTDSASTVEGRLELRPPTFTGDVAARLTLK
jgi:hypothetical protein